MNDMILDEFYINIYSNVVIHYNGQVQVCTIYKVVSRPYNIYIECISYNHCDYKYNCVHR